MTYILEKTYELDNRDKLVPVKYASMLIRPCEWEYDKVLRWIKGKVKEPLTLGGQVAALNDKYCRDDDQKEQSLEEWLIDTELKKGIVPDFEEIRILSYGHARDYIAKTIDLRTKTVVYDNMDMVIERVKEDNKARRS
jgi:hypothetical protein